MKRLFFILLVITGNKLVAHNAGTGTTTPLARLHVTDSNVIFSAPTFLGDPTGFTVPLSGAGTRFMWLPKRSAFRVGTVDNNNWNAGSIGLWSFATGYTIVSCSVHRMF